MSFIIEKNGELMMRHPIVYGLVAGSAISLFWCKYYERSVYTYRFVIAQHALQTAAVFSVASMALPLLDECFDMDFTPLRPTMLQRFIK